MYKTDLKRPSEEQKNRRKEIPVGMKELEFDLNLVDGLAQEERGNSRQQDSSEFLVGGGEEWCAWEQSSDRNVGSRGGVEG